MITVGGIANRFDENGKLVEFIIDREFKDWFNKLERRFYDLPKISEENGWVCNKVNWVYEVRK